jgi:hypothetical protein
MLESAILDIACSDVATSDLVGTFPTHPNILIEIFSIDIREIVFTGVESASVLDQVEEEEWVAPAIARMRLDETSGEERVYGHLRHESSPGLILTLLARPRRASGSSFV